MPTQVKMPDGTMVEMPDNPSPELLARLRAATTAAPKVEPPNWYDAPVRAAKNIGSSLGRGFASLGAGAADALAGSRDVTDIGYVFAGKEPPKLDTSMPVSRELAAMGYQPQTTGEKYVSAAATGVGAAFSNPTALGRPILNALVGASAGAGGELGAQIQGGTGTTGRILGTLGGGLGAGIAGSLRGNTPALAREALSDVNPADLTAAKKAMAEAMELGVPLNASQAMPKPSNIDSIVNTLANSRYGKKVTEGLRNQPQQVAFGMEDQLAQLPGTIRAPQITANNMQEAATAVISGAKKARGTAWKKTYDDGVEALKEAATGKISTVKRVSELLDAEGKPLVTSETVPAAATVGTVPEAAVQAAHKRISDLAAERPNTGLGDMLADLAAGLKTSKGYITDGEKLNGVLKDVTARLKSPDLASKGVDAGGSKFVGDTISQLRDDLGDAFKPIRDANKVFSQLTDEVVDPLKKSVVGDIAGRRGALPDVEAVKSRVNAVFNAGTVPGAASSEILSLEKAVRGIPAGPNAVGGPAAFQDAAKTWLASKVSEASKTRGGRVVPDIAANLHEVFRSTDTKQQGFNDVLVALARSQGMKDNALVTGMNKFMDVVAKAGRRPGSVQGLNAQGAGEIAGANVATSGGVTTVNPLRNAVLRWSERLQANAYSEMDRLLTTPEGIDTLQALAKVPATSPAAQAAVTTFLTLGAEQPKAKEDEDPILNK